MIHGDIGSDPYNTRRVDQLNKMHAAGYRGHVSVTAYYAADVYDVTDAGVKYLGRYNYGRRGYEATNYTQILNKYVTHPDPERREDNENTQL